MIIVVDLHLCNVRKEHEICFCPDFCPLPSSIPTLISTSSGISTNLWDLEFQTSLPQGESIDCHISGVTFKDNWQTFPLQVKTQLRELVFILNKHTGLTININIQGIGGKGGGSRRDTKSCHSWQTGAWFWGYPGRWQALLWLQLMATQENPLLCFMLWNASVEVSTVIMVLPFGSHRKPAMKTMGLSLDPSRPMGLHPYRPRSKPPCSLPSLSIHPGTLRP